MQTEVFHVGAAAVSKVFELNLNGFEATRLLPGFDPANLPAELQEPTLYDPQTGRVLLSVHTWLVRHGGKITLVDTGVGNDKSRAALQVLDHRHEPFLQRLREQGVEPEAVDYILLTHIHADHVGWNTRIQDGVWVPTFPNATVICSEREWRYGAALAAGDQVAILNARKEAGFGEPARDPVSGVFADSMSPLESTGRLRLIAVDGTEVLPGFRFMPTPGHSIDHAAISLISEGREAVFGGDVVHHPSEWYNLDQVSMFCEFPDAARRSRRTLARHLAESGATYFSSHFPHTSVGKVKAIDTGYEWAFMVAD